MKLSAFMLIGGLSFLVSCSEIPTISNVKILNEYSIVYIYYYRLNDEVVDYYWPKIKVENSSSYSARISFSMTYFVADEYYPYFDGPLSISLNVGTGTTDHELAREYAITVPSYTKYGGVIVNASHIRVSFELLQVSPFY
jgi:hypothetical protein